MYEKHWKLLVLAQCLCLVFIMGLGCRGTGSKSTVALDSDPTAGLTESQISQMSFQKEGPNGPGAENQFRSTPSGLKYRILRHGNGKKPHEYNRVQVSYRGWLDDGTVFDSSYERGKPITFKLKNVVKGWTEGMQHVSEGGKIELEIPSSLGYGAQGSPPSVPPHATLHFIVELHEVY